MSGIHVGRLRVAMNEPQDRTIPQVLSVAHHSGARRSWGDIAFDMQGVETLQIFDVGRHL